MSLTVVAHVTLDGVMQGLGGAEEDRSDGFDRGGWAVPYRSAEGGEFIASLFQRASAFLFGRRTFETFRGHWPHVEDSANPIAAPLRDRPKYVVSTTLQEPSWAGTTVLRGTPIQELLQPVLSEPGEVQVHGSATLVRTLLGEHLVDELVLLTYPVVLGQGRRLFDDAGVRTDFELVSSRATSTGVVLSSYRPSTRG